MEAETRLRTRLENRRMLIRTARVSGRKGGGPAKGEDELVFPELAASCTEICARSAAEVSVGSC